MKAKKFLKKRLRKVDNSTWVILTGVVIILTALAYFFLYYVPMPRESLKDDICSEFTCTCCKGSILDTPDSCLMAGGMREYIGRLTTESGDKENVMIESIKKFGIPALINNDLKEKYGLMFLENTPEDTPKIVIEPNEVDLGTISNSKGIVIQDFKIRNDGKEDLIIYDLKTSCACLTSSFINKDGKETVRTGRFSHSEGWTFILGPGEEATLRNYYDPRVTNWQTGHVERIVTITSNDPVYFETGVKIIANLVP